MFNKLSKILTGKPKYKAEIYIAESQFTAEFSSDSLRDCLNWIMAGLTELYATTKESASITKGNYGSIRKLSLFNIKNGVLSINQYHKPGAQEHIYMTDTMLYIPDSVLSEIRKEPIKFDFDQMMP